MDRFTSLAIIGRRPSPAMLVALVALMLAMAGTSYGADAVSSATQLITGKQIAKNAVKERQLGRGAVTSAKVRDFSLVQRDFRPGQLPAGVPGPAGPEGPAGPAGPTGPEGAKGDPGATQVVARRAGANTLGQTTPTVNAFCNAGETVVGGGGWFQTGVEGDRLVWSRPAMPSGDAPISGQAPTGWSVKAHNAKDAAATTVLSVFVLCASP